MKFFRAKAPLAAWLLIIGLAATAHGYYGAVQLWGDNPMYVEQGAVFTDPGALIWDYTPVPDEGMPDPGAYQITIDATEGSVDTNTPGEYTLVYAGYYSSATRTVFVVAPASTEPLVTLDTVTVGDAGNAADTRVMSDGTTGYGAVDYAYSIGKHEVTIAQYVTFLNAVAKTNSQGYITSLWKPGMAADPYVAGISRIGSGAAGNPYIYTAIGSSNRPVAYVSWFDAARFANWMHNGATNGASTETGAYTLNGATNGVISRNAEAIWWIPNESEWYKAAYYKTGGTNAGYWLYPAKSDSEPGNVVSATANQANFARHDGSKYYFSLTQSQVRQDTNYLTDVGSYSGSPGPYGTFDQGGNLYEWNDAVIGVSSRGLRGGSWDIFGNTLYSTYRGGAYAPEFASNILGFRLAKRAPVAPELVFVEGGVLPDSSELAGQNVTSFRIGKYEVTFGEWREVRDWAVTNGYSDLSGRGTGGSDSHPVRLVNWFDAVKWCNAKSEKDGLQPVYYRNGEVFRQGEGPDDSPYDPDGAVRFVIDRDPAADGYRLPTEAEWEWAARGGRTSGGFTYSGSDDLNAVGWFQDNSSGAPAAFLAGRGTYPVGRKQPNELGIYDMSGNASEWCWDPVGDWRRVRGGDFSVAAATCAVGARSADAAAYRDSHTYVRGGFRIVTRAVTGAILRIEEPSGKTVTNNAAAKTFGHELEGTVSATRTYTIRNTGAGPLTSIALSKLGAHANDFTLTPPATNSLAPGATTTFSVSFAPTTGGTRTAQLSITSSDTNNTPFLVNLTGLGLGGNLDTDGDGLNDAAEYRFAALGFDWQLAQPGLVGMLFSNANSAGLYSATDISANPALFGLFTKAQYDANRTNGHTDVTTNPAAYGLFTAAQYEAHHTAGRAVGKADVTSNPATFGLFTKAQHDANRTNGRTDVTTNPAAYGLLTAAQYEVHGNARFDSGRLAGRSDVTTNPSAFDLFTKKQYESFGGAQFGQGASSILDAIPKVDFTAPPSTPLRVGLGAEGATGLSANNLPVGWQFDTNSREVVGRVEGTSPIIITLTAQRGTNAPIPFVLGFTAQKAQSISTFAPISAQVFSGSAPSFEVSVPASDAGLAVSLSVKSGPAIIAGDRVVTMTGKGRVVLAANQEGNAQFAPAAEATTSFMVVEPGVDATRAEFEALGGWQAYLAANQNLFVNAGKHDEETAFVHWRDLGRFEGRSFDQGRLASELPGGGPDPNYAIEGGFAWKYPRSTGREGNTVVFITRDAIKPAGWDGRGELLKKGDLFNLGSEYSAVAYRQLNPDVAQAIDTAMFASFASVTDHYVKYGFKEGRLTNGNWTQAQLDAWNDEDYLTQNPDVRSFFMGAQGEGWKLLGKVGFAHYINFGRWEGRGTGQ